MLRLIAWSVAWYAALVLLWPWTAPGVESALRWGTESLWNGIAPDHAVRCRDAPPQGTAADTVVVLRPGGRMAGGFFVSTFQTAFQPAAVFLALALATRARARRKITGIALGMLLVVVFIVVRVLAAIAIHYEWLSATRGAEPKSELVESVLEALFVVIWSEPTTNYVVGILVWALALWSAHGGRDAPAGAGRRSWIRERVGRAAPS